MSSDLERLYEALSRLERGLGGVRRLRECDARSGWPERGVYFFFEPGETRSGTSAGLRVVRVGTHALKEGSRTSLWNRLSSHRGVAGTGSGNHRGSIFRLLVGEALLRREGREVRSWGVGTSVGAAVEKLGTTRSDIEASERPVEEAVSRYIGAMPFLWVSVPDPPGPGSARGIIERGSIALLAGAVRSGQEAVGDVWLGGWSSRDPVRAAGLWNNQHVDEDCDPGFLDEFDRAVERSIQANGSTR